MQRYPSAVRSQQLVDKRRFLLGVSAFVADDVCDNLGDVDGWVAEPHRLSVRDNPFATSSLAAVLALMGRDAARRRRGPGSRV